jgi:3',5'-nucleoside bisphosphate phosphatase
MRVDLHMHSTASDGAFPPEEVVRLALARELDVIALTDHDNVSGIRPAQHAAQSTKLNVLAGVELSSEDEKTDRHILGYLMDIDNQPLQAVLAELRDARTSRAERMVQKLAAIGVNIPMERVNALADKGSVGRPHVARVLVEKGYVSTLQEAFDRYLGNDGPAYVPHYRLEPTRAIELIHGASGVAILAHPGHYDDYRAVIEALVPLGLDGLEVYYPDHTPPVIAELEVVAQEFGLTMTVGSDFHRREADGSIRIGSVRTPDSLDLVAMLRERAKRYQS